MQINTVVTHLYKYHLLVKLYLHNIICKRVFMLQYFNQDSVLALSRRVTQRCVIGYLILLITVHVVSMKHFFNII